MHSTRTPIAPDRRRRQRRTRRVGIAAAAAIVCVVALSACTPSGYTAERTAVQSHHWIMTGQNVSYSNVTCNEFTSTESNVYTGVCWAGSEAWGVTSSYNEGHTAALVTVGKWDGSQTGYCEATKAQSWAAQC